MAIELSHQRTMNKEYQKAAIPEGELALFRDNIKKMFENLDAEKDEEHNRKLLMDCLKQSLYPHNAFNTDSKTDFVIYADEYSKGSNPVVLVETKKMDSDEMIKPSKMNRKGLHQLILYYMRQESMQNVGVKHLIVTDFNNVYIFDKMNFLRLFATSRDFANRIKEADKQKYSTDTIYKELIAPKVTKEEDRLEYIHIDLKKIYNIIKKNEEKSLKNKELIRAYKLLSPIYLLKQKYGYNHNTLNQAFYDELLFIMGLEERKDKSSNTLRIVRKEEGDRHFFTFIEQAIFKIKEKESLTDEEELFEQALGLVIVWINRILFIKLLESQLKEYVGNDDVKILDPSVIKSYSDLNALFFHVLAHQHEERRPEFDKFKDVPYLNSSLFEESEQEIHTRITIDNIILGKIPVYEKTKVRTADGRIVTEDMCALHYLLDFLNSYDFGSYSKTQDADNLINAAVLGLIFEKINGYKDGAYFTPSYITEYMCRETIRMALLRKFNEKEGHEKYLDFDDLKRNLPKRTLADVEYANEVVNSLRICDPSVGSGHFLVSALNELIAIKSELGILCEHTSEKLPLGWDVKVANDELYITNGFGQSYQYDPSNTRNRIVQESLFEEKRILIENCLFGVDINPKSVDICKLRLWIELLKNSYYINNGGKSRLVTLPNIDTNVKCGNSLLSYRRVCVGKPYSSDPNSIPLVQDYKDNVWDYKNNNDKKAKAKLAISIAQIKERLHNNTKNNLFDEREEVNSDERKMYSQAFEWMIEFPELLDNDGAYEGFDIVIGNPPYISLQTIKQASRVYGKILKDNHGRKKPRFATYEAKGDIYSLFFERAVSILKPKGLMCFITSNKWMNTEYGRTTQSFLSSHTNPIRLIDFPGLKLFDKATVETNILLCSLSENKDHTLSVSIGKKEKAALKSLWSYVHENSMVCHFADSIGWRIEGEMDLDIMGRIRNVGKAIKDIKEIVYNRGVTTGNNDAFLISNAIRESILNDCLDEEERRRTDDLIQPLLRGQDLAIYNTPNHEKWLIALFPSRKYDIEEYPAVKRFLLTFAKEDLCKRGYSWVAEEYLEEYCQRKLQQDHKEIVIDGQQILDATGNFDYGRKKSSNKWFETQDNIAYWEEFAKPKILWKRIGSKLRTTYDASGAYGLDSTCLATGKYTSFLCCLFNSHVGRYLLSRGQHTGTGDLLVSCQAIEPVLVPIENVDVEKFDQWVGKQVEVYSEDIQKEIDREIFRIYGFDENIDKDIIKHICIIADKYK